METIYIKQDLENYGSMDTSPQGKVRQLNDSIFVGNYVFLTKFIVLGPHWPLFLCTLIGFDTFAYYTLKQQKEQGNDITIGLMITILQAICYIFVGIANPGISNDCQLNQQYQGQLYTLGTKSSLRSVWYCERCQKIQPPKADHCIFCKICIQQFDHHCPWTGKCIGKGNILYFWAFIISTIIFFSYFINLMMQSKEK